jgi:hypothetical protein
MATRYLTGIKRKNNNPGWMKGFVIPSANDELTRSQQDAKADIVDRMRRAGVIIGK